MKPLPTFLSLLAGACLVLASAATIAQTWKTPTKLSGRWNSPDSRDFTSLSVSLDAAANTGQLTISFPEQRCSFRGAPATMTNQGGRIILKSAEGWASMCVTDMTLEMVPNPGPGGEVGYRGELRLTGSAANRGPILRGRLTQP